MSEYSAKTLREKMKAKARSLANPGNYYKDQEVSSSDWSPAPPLRTEMKTGARPIMKPSAKGTGESYAARDTKAAIGADMKRGAFKAGGAVKKSGVSIPTPKETLSTKEIIGANPIRPTRGKAENYKKGGKIKKNIGGVLEKISPAYAAMRSIQRGPDEEQQTKSRLQEAAMINAARGAKKGGKIKKAGGGSMLEKMVGKPKTGSDMSQVGKMGSARYPTEEKETMKEIISPRDTTKETVETMERLGEAGRKKGGRTGRDDGGSVKIPKTMHKFDSDGKIIPPTRYDIYNIKNGKVVGKAKSRTGSSRAVDRRDNDYGAYAHRAVPVYADAPSSDDDRAERKSGGRTRAKGKTNINIVIAAGRKAGPEAPALDMAGGMPSAPANIPVPMPGAGAPPPAAMPMGGPPGMPAPGLLPGRKAGGRISKVAGSYKSLTAGSGSGIGREQKTSIAEKHKGAPTRKTGGRAVKSYKQIDAGSGSGIGRIEKTAIAGQHKNAPSS